MWWYERGVNGICSPWIVMWSKRHDPIGSFQFMKKVCDAILPKICFIHKNLGKWYKQKDMTQDNFISGRWPDAIRSKIKWFYANYTVTHEYIMAASWQETIEGLYKLRPLFQTLHCCIWLVRHFWHQTPESIWKLKSYRSRPITASNSFFQVMGN